MTAVLVVMTWLGGYTSGPTISMQEISTMDRCNAAAQTVRDEAKAWRAWDSFRAFCVQK